MVIFNSYVKLPEGNLWNSNTEKKAKRARVEELPPFHIFRGQGSSTEELLPEHPQDQKWDDKLKKTW